MASKDLGTLITDNIELRTRLSQLRAEYLKDRKEVIRAIKQKYENTKRVIEHQISENVAMIEENVASVLLDPKANREVCTDYHYQLPAEMMTVSDEAAEGHQKRTENIK